MTNLIEGLYHTIEGILQSIIAVLQSAVNVVYSLVHGVVSLVWNTLESVAAFIGASVHFLISNIVILLLIAVGVYFYNNRNTRGTLGNDIKKKAQ